jgi:hypothetical protein
MSDLKNCPFCGGEAKKWEGNDGWWIECYDGHGGCMVSTEVYETEARAIEAWNRRAGDDTREAIEAEIVAALRAIGSMPAAIYSDWIERGEYRSKSDA